MRALIDRLAMVIAIAVAALGMGGCVVHATTVRSDDPAAVHGEKKAKKADKKAKKADAAEETEAASDEGDTGDDEAVATTPAQMKKRAFKGEGSPDKSSRSTGEEDDGGIPEKSDYETGE